MSRELLNLKQGAALLSISEKTLRSMAVQGEIPCKMRGDAYFFEQETLDLWKSGRIIDGAKEVLDEDGFPHPLPIPEECVCANLPGSTRASIVKALTELAEKSGFLFDPADFMDGIIQREEQGSTNIGGGIAIPHLLTREEGFFSESFICLAKLARPAFFNAAPDGSATELLILSCCKDSYTHLAMLKRISDICRKKNFMEAVRNAETDAELLMALRDAEKR